MSLGRVLIQVRMSEAADVRRGKRPALPWRDLSARKGDPLMWVQTRRMRLGLTRVTQTPGYNLITCFYAPIRVYKLRSNPASLLVK